MTNVPKSMTDEGFEEYSAQTFTETFGLSQINDIFQQTLEHKLLKRSVLTPDF